MHKESVKPRLLVYGIEKAGIQPPASSISNTLFELDFCPFEATKKFQDYDGVILFHSTFEIYSRIDTYHGLELRFSYYREELLRRRSQLRQLLEGKGYVCFLIYRDFHTHVEGHDTKDKDLAKLFLPSSIYPSTTSNDLSIAYTYRSEFTTFLKTFGNVRTRFSYYGRIASHIRNVCATYDQKVAGFIAYDSRYFIPCRLPGEDEAREFFVEIAKALVSTSAKLRQELPDWVDDFRFPPEEYLLTKEEELQKELEDMQSQKDVWNGYKRSLCYDGDLLVDSVVAVLKEGLGLHLDNKSDQGIEDKVIQDGDGNDIILVEIKGTNENVKSTNIYQADSHRGRRDKTHDFPSILIMNTFIKSSNSIEDKCREINSEQVKLAVLKKVLVMRTIDLLNLLHLKEQGKVNQNKISKILTESIGWLSVSQDTYEVKEA